MRALLEHCVETVAGPITVRRLNMHDTSDVFEMCKDPLVSKHMTWHSHKDRMETERYMFGVCCQYKVDTLQQTWAIVENATGKVVGTCGYLAVDVELRRAEIAYCLAPSAWGKGYATQAVDVLEQWARKYGLVRLQATCTPENIASKKLLLKRGWKCEGLLRSYALEKSGSTKLVDVEMWSCFCQYAFIAKTPAT